jgi:hypothetical protein
MRELLRRDETNSTFLIWIIFTAQTKAIVATTNRRNVSLAVKKDAVENGLPMSGYIRATETNSPRIRESKYF